MVRKTADPGKITARIDTSVPYEVKLDCIKKNWSFNDVFIEGYRSKIMNEEGTSKNSLRIKVAEQKLTAVMKHLKVRSPILYDEILKAGDDVL